MAISRARRDNGAVNPGETFFATLAVVTLGDWIGVGVILVAAIAIILGTRRIVRTITAKTGIKDYEGNLVMRIVTTVVVIVAILYALSLLDIQIGPLLGALGIFTVVIAYALQPFLANLIGSITLHGSRPIKPGDQIESNGVQGTVIDVHPRATEILTFEGTTVHIPNSAIINNPLTNRTADFDRRSDIPFQVSFGSDLRASQRVVAKALRLVDGVSDTPRPEVLVQGFGESGIDMVARFWHPSEELTSQWVISEAAITIRQALEENNIVIPYPHRIMHQDPSPDSSNQENGPTELE